MTVTASESEGTTVEYLLYWASPAEARRVAGSVDAIRQLPLPYRCDERDEALGHARLRLRAGMIPLMIEGSDGTLISREGIERELRLRADQLQDRPRKR
jgi:hypothetical protein